MHKCPLLSFFEPVFQKTTWCTKQDCMKPSAWVKMLEAMLPEVPHQTNKPGESISNSPEQLWNTSSPTLKCNLGLKAASSKSSPQRRSSMQAYCLPRMTALTDIARILATLLILLLQVCHEDDYENEAQNLEQCFFFLYECILGCRAPTI